MEGKEPISIRIMKKKRVQASSFSFKNREEVALLIQLIMDKELLEKSWRKMAEDYDITAPTLKKRYEELVKKL